jgi:hypothetical protein
MIDVTLQRDAYHEIPFLNAAPGNRGIAVRERLPFLRATVSGLPAGAPLLVAAADLQGRMKEGGTADSLLGCAVADGLPKIQAAAGLPAPETMIGLLAGDFYAEPNATKRGGIGDVNEVWLRMRSKFMAIAGVLGNHDLFGASSCASRLPDDFVDGAVRELAGLRIGGVSGIIGDPARPNRRSADEYAEMLLRVLDQRPDILLLHAAPHIVSGSAGEALIAEWIQATDFDGLVVCGHIRWRERVHRCGRAAVLNVNGAVVTLVPSSQTQASATA